MEHNNMSWEQFLQHRAQNSVYANEFFIRCTALLLNIDILYVSDTSTKQTPFSLISCTSNDSNQLLEGRQLAHMLSDNSNSIPVIRLANVDSNHFQSLVLRNSEPNNTLSRVTGLDSTYADAAKKNLKANTKNGQTSQDHNTPISSPPRKVKVVSSNTPKTSGAQNLPLLTQGKSVPEVPINTASSATEVVLQKVMSSIYSSRSTNVAWNKYVTHEKKLKDITYKKQPSVRYKKKEENVRYKAFIKKENELKGKCMSLSLPYEAPKDQETHAELKLRRLRINHSIKNKQKYSSSKNITDNKENVKSFQINNDQSTT